MAEEKKERKNTFNTKLFEVCADDKLRPLFQCVHFENGYAYATNSYCLIKQSLDLQSVLNKENLEGKSLHKDSYKAIMAFEIAECNIDGVYCKNVSGQTAFFDYFNRNDEAIPNFEAALNSKRVRDLTFIGIDAEMLSKLNKALHNPCNNLRMQFTGVDTPIIIDVPGVEGQIAHLMPKILNDSLF